MTDRLLYQKKRRTNICLSSGVDKYVVRKALTKKHRSRRNTAHGKHRSRESTTHENTQGKTLLKDKHRSQKTPLTKNTVYGKHRSRKNSLAEILAAPTETKRSRKLRSRKHTAHDRIAGKYVQYLYCSACRPFSRKKHHFCCLWSCVQASLAAAAEALEAHLLRHGTIRQHDSTQNKAKKQTKTMTRMVYKKSRRQQRPGGSNDRQKNKNKKHD